MTTHPLSSQDQQITAAIRAAAAPNKGKLQGIGARAPFDMIIGQTAAADGVTYQEDRVGGVSGWWCRPAKARRDEVVLHLHGGWFHWGSAQAFRHLVGQIARRAGVAMFVPDYRLAPENPFPAGLEDALACYHGLEALGYERIALSGDSAGGNLALVLAAELKERVVGVAALSPVTDLTFSSPSWETQAEAEFYFVRSQAEELVRTYLGATHPANPLVSPLFGDLRGLPPIRVHVGDQEMLLDDSQRYVDRAVEAGVDARLDVWTGMPHGFAGGVGKLDAAGQALDAVGAFLADRLAGR